MINSVVKKLYLHWFLFALAGAPAFASDATIGLQTGGIEVARLDVISIASMDVKISREEIRIDYTFRNESNVAVETQMFFLMPAIRGGIVADVSIPRPQSENFLGFELNVHGQTVAPTLEQRATAHGVDVTKDLLALTYHPLVPVGDQIFSKIENTYAVILEKMLARGIIKQVFYDDGNGFGPRYFPGWKLNSTYSWKVEFDPNGEAKISVRYLPSVGQFHGVRFLENSSFFRQDLWDVLDAKYCLGESYWTDLEQVDGEVSEQLSESTIVLEMAVRRVGEFTLLVKSISDSEQISLCGENFTEVEPGIYQQKMQNYLLPERFEILFLEHARLGAFRP